MKKALITGINGFVGPYLKRELEENGYEVYGFDLKVTGKDDFSCDITDFDQVSDVISKVRPDCIFHLAGFSSVARSFEFPELCFKVNVIGTKNLLDAVVKAGIKPKILIVSSADAYGKPKYVPIDEKHPLDPVSPYGKSRIEQEKLTKEYDLPIIISRSFSHTADDQPDQFVIPSFKKQVREAKDGDTIFVGNLDVNRDFSHVKDVVKAYRLLIEKGKAGEVYNVGSGKGSKLSDVLDKLIKESGKNLQVKVDPDKFRKADITVMICDNRKIKDMGIKIDSLF